MSRRWRQGLGYIDAISGHVHPPRIAISASERVPGRTVCQVIQDRDAGRRACRLTAESSLSRLLRAARVGDLSSWIATCHVGLHELVAPIASNGECVGALLCGGFLLDDDAQARSAEQRRAVLERVEHSARELELSSDRFRAARADQTWLSTTELSFIRELVEAAAGEIALFYGQEVKRRRTTGLKVHTARERYDAIIGKSPPMQELYSILDRVVQSDSTVLIQGENGTGKELVARAIHRGSPRASQRFVVTNCSAFNDNLLDSELFGHKKGAFTGAISDKQGLFEVADRGTFFLDEIGDMSPSLQVKVLRVLQEGTFIPVGDTDTRKVDVRIIAATNRDLKAMVASGEFREDLYYRINVINLHIPPLRERREDISLLVKQFLRKHTRNGRIPVKTLSDACFARLMHYDWPGNVRELENEIERLVVLAGDDAIIDESLLSQRIRHHTPSGSLDLAPHTLSLPEAMRRLERRMILDALKRHNWNKTRASAELEISRRNLIRLVKKYDLEAER